jgi:hypothetical protein
MRGGFLSKSHLTPSQEKIEEENMTEKFIAEIVSILIIGMW